MQKMITTQQNIKFETSWESGTFTSSWSKFEVKNTQRFRVVYCSKAQANKNNTQTKNISNIPIDKWDECIYSILGDILVRYNRGVLFFI